MATSKTRGQKPSPGIPQYKRAMIKPLIDQGLSKNDIAQVLGISPVSVMKHAQAMGLEFHGMLNLRNHIDARREQTRQRRRQLAEALLDDVDKIRELTFSDGEVVTARGHLVQGTRPYGHEVQAFMSAAGVALKRSMELEESLGDASETERSLLGELARSMGVVGMGGLDRAEDDDDDH